MKELLSAIKAQLQTDLTYVRDSDIFIAEDDDLVPQSVRFPAVGIKDGPVQATELASDMMEYTLTVRIIPYVQLVKPEAAVMGDASTSSKGILEMEEDIHQSLDENLLGIDGMQSAVGDPNRPESELFGDEEEMVLRKKITYRYVKEELRP